VTDTDLFGEPIKQKTEPAVGPKKRKDPVPAGYADRPGTGPAGKTCKHCRHLYRHKMSKTYLKCWLMRPAWTSGGKTDIRAASPACSKFEPIQNATS
jgi:hypothetical protein